VDCVLEGTSAGEVELFFVSEERICALHHEHFNDPTPTDCMTFPMDPVGPDCKMLGSVFVCPKIAICYAKEHGQDPYRECMLYVVHGLLHLLGYKDKIESDKLEMRKAEETCMAILAERGLILTPPT